MPLYMKKNKIHIYYLQWACHVSLCLCVCIHLETEIDFYFKNTEVPRDETLGTATYFLL